MARSGLVLVDKPAGWTSHDVVARVRRLAGTRRVGHAGTLDPMATGVLVLGVERATKLLGHLALVDKSYDATIRLGEATVTDDAEGEVCARVGAQQLAEVTDGGLRAGLQALTGTIEQVPSAVSAVKIDGKRAYARVRAGEAVQIPARTVTVARLDLLAVRRSADRLDLDVSLDCSTGTYVRALARDLGAALGVGGHLIGLRRTRVGPFALDRAATLTELAARPYPVAIDLAAAVRDSFPRRDVDGDQARALSHGRPLPAAGVPGIFGAFAPDGTVLALLEDDEGAARPRVVFAPA